MLQPEAILTQDAQKRLATGRSLHNSSVLLAGFKGAAASRYEGMKGGRERRGHPLPEIPDSATGFNF